MDSVTAILLAGYAVLWAITIYKINDMDDKLKGARLSIKILEDKIQEDCE